MPADRRRGDTSWACPSRLGAGCGLPLVVLLTSLACSPSPPDVVLVSIDCLRADHLGAYGYHAPTSPTFDRLAQEGVLFRNAVSTTSWTLPAHSSLFTGLYGSAHGVTDDSRPLGSNHHTLAEALANAGYQTAGFYGGPYLAPVFGLDQGFQVWESCYAQLEGVGSQLHRASHHSVTGPRTLAAVQRWLETTGEGNNPLFLFVHLWDVHYDYQAPPRYVELFDPGYEGPVDGRDFEGPAIHPGIPARDLQHLIALYDAEIRFTDDTVKRLLDLLAGANRHRSTLLIITADHGEEFFDHGQKGHEKTLYEEVVRVPLLFHWPGSLPAGLVVESQARLVDVTPTILSLVGVPDATEMQGRDLSPALAGEPLTPVPALMELQMLGRSTVALRTDHWVLIASKDGTPRLYDLRQDPGQQSPRGAEDYRWAIAVRALQAEARRARDYLQRHPPEDSELELDQETLHRLQALGYREP